jgi:hypothetical protein
MQVKQLFALGAIAFAASAVMADELPSNSAPLTRNQVVQSVLAARASGQLRPTGAAGDQPQAWIAQPASASRLARGTVENEVITARASGELRPAGEAGDEPMGWSPTDTSSRVSRAQVVAETLQARANGELIPAGEDVEGARGYTSSQFAHAKTPMSTTHASLSHTDSNAAQ